MSENSKILFTTSWDDGHELDLKLQDLLSGYGLKGTFYIPKDYNLRSLNESEIRFFAQNQEVGAHSLTHPDLPGVSLEKSREEIFGSKKYLEELLGQEVKMFCYPSGFYNDSVKNLVREAGFLGARTTKEWFFGGAFDFFEMPVSLHIYPFPFRPLSSLRQYKNPKNFLAPFLQNYQEIIKRRLNPKTFFGWQNLARASFLYAKERGRIFHLFGHSWEIEKYGMWRELEKFLKFVADNKDNLIFLTNSETLEFFSRNV
ncbi:MAG: polysaccharide deacetylase family protein [Patescibacteria group bacterium]